MASFYHLLAAGARHGGAFLRDAAGEPRYTYDKLDGAVARFARRLLRADLAPGDRVLVQVEKSPECLLLYLACLRAGLVYLPLNPAYRRDELAYFVEDAEPGLVVCDPAREALFGELGRARSDPHRILTLDGAGEGSLVDSLGDEEGELETLPREPDDVAVIVYTSGTTGRPKGAMISHGNLEANARALSRCWGWRREDRMLHALPIFHVHGLFLGVHLPAMNGSPITLLGRFDPAEVVAQLPDHTVYMGVPTHYVRLLALRARLAGSVPPGSGPATG